MDPVMQTIVWFAPIKGGPNSAAKQVLKEAGFILGESCFLRGNLYYEGTHPDKKVCVKLLSLWNDTVASKIAEKADHIFLSGTMAGRPDRVKVGDVIGVSGCYHIDRGAYTDMSGKKTCNITPRLATEDVINKLETLTKTKLESKEVLPVSISTRRDWVLEHLNLAEKPLPQKELFDFATDKNAIVEERNKEWKKVVGFLKENKYLAYDQGQLQLTEKGKLYCENNTLQGYFEPSNSIQIHCGPIITSMGSHAEFFQKEKWKEYDTAQLSPVGLDKDAFDILGTFPKATVIKAVSHYAGEDKGSRKEVIQLAAAKVVTHIISEI
jgi:hypothetical protein